MSAVHGHAHVSEFRSHPGGDVDQTGVFGVQVKGIHPIQRCRPSNGFGDAWCACFEFVLVGLVGGTLGSDGFNHVASAHERLHFLKGLRLNKQGTDAGGTAHFVRRKRHEICAK